MDMKVPVHINVRNYYRHPELWWGRLSRVVNMRVPGRAFWRSINILKLDTGFYVCIMHMYGVVVVCFP